MTEEGQHENGHENGKGNGKGDGKGRASLREQVQVGLILRSVANVAAFPENWERREQGADFLYRTDKLIVRDANLESVRQFLDEEQGVRNDIDVELPMAGSTRLSVASKDDGAFSIHDVLTEIERRHGQGAAGLDHLFYVCVHACAAIEPEEADPNGDPEPRPQTETDSNHGRGVDVRVIDGGLVEDAAKRHAWMSGVTGEVDNPLDANGRIRPDGGHGTFTAGCVRVTAPEADVHVVNAASRLPMNAGSDEIGAVFESELANLLREQLVADKGEVPIKVPDVMVLNFAGTTRNGAPPVALAALYDSVIQHLKELVIVCPAGNEGDFRKNWPASFAWVVSVGALDEDGRQIANWSNRGRSVDVYAPGDKLVNAFATGDYETAWEGPGNSEIRTFDGMARWSGTSFATPLVAGLVASRMSTTMQSSRRAWQSLLDQAEQHALPGVGPVLFPGQELG